MKIAVPDRLLKKYLRRHNGISIFELKKLSKGQTSLENWT